MFSLSPEYWEVRKTKDRGHGVFARKDIPAGIVLGDYLGKLIRVDEEEKYEDDQCFYLMYYHDRASIFPDGKKAGIHLINHSCEPNTYMYTYQGHTLYFALRQIFAGEEITVSYLLSPLDDDCAPCPHACKCYSEICTNTMHATNKVYDKWREFDEQMMKGIKLPRVKYNTELTKLPHYPTSISDNAIYPLFGSTNKPPVSLPDTKVPSQKILRKTIRETGQQLYFPKLGLNIMGISDNHLICKN